MPRGRGLTITFGVLGRGQVNSDLPAEDLAPPGERRVLGPVVPSATNLRLLDDMATTRPGYASYANTPATDPVNGMFQAIFDNDTEELLRADENDWYRLVGTTWTALTTPALSGAATDTWQFAMVRRSGSSATRNQVFGCNGVDDLFTYTSGGAAVTAVGAATFSGPKAVIAVGGRALVGNCEDSGGTRRETRIYYSIVGDPTDFTGTGSGFVDLDDDPYPIQAFANMGGRVQVYKGDENGGSVVIGTRTGNVSAPFRWDTISSGTTEGVGILCPRTLVILSPGVAFFVGHDGFYLHDGARGLRPVAQGVTRDILSRLDRNALQGAFAYYRPDTFEVVVGIPSVGSTWPNEYWVYNVRQDRVYGPWSYANTLTAVSFTTASGALTWLTLPDATWSAMPYPNWPSIDSSETGIRSFLFGTDDGKTFEDDSAQAADAGVTVTGTWTSPAVTPEGYFTQHVDAASGRPVVRQLEAEDVLTLRDVTLRYRDNGSWTPTVQVSTNGTSWTTVSDGVAIGSGSSRLLTKTYSMELASQWFQLRVIGGTDMRLHTVTTEFTYSGGVRNELEG